MKKLISVLALTFAATAAPAIGGVTGSVDGSSYTLELRGYVPVICKASLSNSSVPLQAGQTQLGEMREFCNNASGYQVWLDHAAGLEGAAIVDGQRVPLASSGSTLISASSTAAVRKHDVALELGQDAGSVNLSVRVVAL